MIWGLAEQGLLQQRALGCVLSLGIWQFYGEWAEGKGWVRKSLREAVTRVCWIRRAVPGSCN